MILYFISQMESQAYQWYRHWLYTENNKIFHWWVKGESIKWLQHLWNCKQNATVMLYLDVYASTFHDWYSNCSMKMKEKTLVDNNIWSLLDTMMKEKTLVDNNIPVWKQWTYCRHKYLDMKMKEKTIVDNNILDWKQWT